ncbi:DUF421 domain-containing protein [Lottiidibacillus patelloidae]|uniref:DUF421 domain-containing protein n=1 Tax=Lottiidibacillus patelloidae TaxID=2670334 RepID=A0A263BUY8_9BACI|nr:DUF421 domain-containing protein [Lottiidibacillus patelloidae]OZM57563.1 DUF421 domain-containing protein [Lottiidibacillus patelloidae]
MPELIKDSLLVIGRIVTILPLLLFVTIYMGKRSIAQLPVFDLLIILTLGSVVGADIADPEIKHIPTVVAIIAIGLLQRFVAKLKISRRNIGRLITFEPTVVIQDGKILNGNLKKIRYSIDNVLQMLREKNIFDVSEIETAIIESSGNISVLKKSEKRETTLEDIGKYQSSSMIALPVIIEGEVFTKVLKEYNVTELWLKQQLATQGIHKLNDVFFASINKNLQLHVSLKEEKNIKIPTLYH